MKQFISYGIFLLSAVVLAACSAGSPAGPAPAKPGDSPASRISSASQWDATVAAARKEGEVRVYGLYGPDARQAIVPVMANKYGINVDFVAGRGPETAQKIVAESRAGIFLADVLIMGAEGIVSLIKPHNILTDVQPFLMMPEVIDPKAWPDDRLPFVDKERNIMMLTSGYRTYTFINKDLVKEGALTSYAGMVQPAWRDKIAMLDPTTPGASAGFMTLMLNIFGREGGAKYMRDLAAQKPVILRDARLLSQWVATGKYPIGIGVSQELGYSLIKSGAPVSWLQASEGGGMHPTGACLALPAKAPHPAAATVLANWLLSAEGQRVFTQAFGNPPTRKGVSIEGLDPFSIAKPGTRLYYLSDESIQLDEVGRGLSREIFGPLMK